MNGTGANEDANGKGGTMNPETQRAICELRTAASLVSVTLLTTQDQLSRTVDQIAILRKTNIGLAKRLAALEDRLGYVAETDLRKPG